MYCEKCINALKQLKKMNNSNLSKNNDNQIYGQIKEILTTVKAYSASILRRIRQFYLAFLIRDAVSPELGWTRYKKYILYLSTEQELKKEIYAIIGENSATEQ